MSDEWSERMKSGEELAAETLKHAKQYRAAAFMLPVEGGKYVAFGTLEAIEELVGLERDRK